MKRLDARNENWMPMEIRGVAGYFNDMRIDRATVPGCFNFWELADGDSDGIPCRYRFGILANFYGTFLTTGNLPVDDAEYNSGYIGDGEWSFTGGRSLPFADILNMEMERMVRTG